MAETYRYSTWIGAGHRGLRPTITVALLLTICVLAFDSLPVSAAAQPATGTEAASTGSVGGNRGTIEAASQAIQIAMSDTRTRTLVNLVNSEREDARLSPLILDERLCIVARRHAEDMIRSGYFGHVSPNSGTLAGRLAAAGVTFGKAGENLAGNTSVSDAHRMLMESPVHRGNVLNSEFTRIGAAVVKGGPYGMMIVEVFADECAEETSVAEQANGVCSDTRISLATTGMPPSCQQQ